MSKKKADKKKGGFVRAIRNIFVFLIACALLILLGLTGIYIYVKHDVKRRTQLHFRMWIVLSFLGHL